MRYYLAGGAVRDILLGIGPREFDIVFDGPPGDFTGLHKNTVHTVGRDKQTYIVNGHDHMSLAGGIAEDLRARDLTINALLMAENGVIHALPETFADLAQGILRHASPTAFFNDPARVFRAARFSAVLPGFAIAPETVDHMRETAEAQLLQTIAGERVGRECTKAMAGRSPSNFLTALAKADCLKPWFLPLDIARRIPAGPAAFHGDKTVFEHTCDVMDRLASMQYTLALPDAERALAAWMGLCHDLGKIETEPAKLPRHIGHESRGHGLVDALAATLRLPKLWERAGHLAVSLHMRAGRYTELRPATKVDLLCTLAKSRLAAPFCALIMADAKNAALAEILLRDMASVLAVTLPEAWRNKGERSGNRLRELRINALRRASSPGTRPQ